jgi:hypothetical protein
MAVYCRLRPARSTLLTPFVHYLPRRWQAPLVRRATVWALLTGIKGDRKQFYIEHYLADVRLLSRRELQTLFPRATIVSERFLGFTKSLLARVP